MGRGAISKGIRQQNRALLAGNPDRANPYAGMGYRKGFRRTSEKGKKGPYGLQRCLWHDDKMYRLEYMLKDDGELKITGIIHYPEPKVSVQYKIIKPEDPIADTICKKLLITLQVEQAQKNQ